MIVIKHQVINTIPVLELVDSELQETALPLVVFYHGWCNVKESVLVNGYELAKRGMRALLPEALYHGERQVGGGPETHYLDFWNIIKQNIIEFPELVRFFADQNLVEQNKVGATGLSMGGITTCGVLKTYDWLTAAVCLMGSPNLRQFAKQVCQELEQQGVSLPSDTAQQIAALESYDLSAAPAKIAGRPFHFWHGTNDDQVPYAPTYAFYQQVKNTDYGRNVSFTTTDGGHKVPYSISVEMADFFQTHFFASEQN